MTKAAVRCRERQPQELAAANHGLDTGTNERGHKVCLARGVTLERTRIQYLDIGDDCTRQRWREAGSNGFDLWKFWHGYLPPW
jgi:hypothetical protein